jgi:hypothetical protein
MVTREQYDEALKICLEYKIQIELEVKEISGANNLLIDMLYKGEISTRFFNIVCKNLDYFFKDLEGINCNLYTLSDLLKLEPKNVLRLRNSGKKNMQELINIKEKYIIN